MSREECQLQVSGFKGAVCKSFSMKSYAFRFFSMYKMQIICQSREKINFHTLDILSLHSPLSEKTDDSDVNKIDYRYNCLLAYFHQYIKEKTGPNDTELEPRKKIIPS